MVSAAICSTAGSTAHHAATYATGDPDDARYATDDSGHDATWHASQYAAYATR